MSFAVGSVLGDRYRITAPIATGGMGEVFEADDVVLGRSVAVKLLKTDLAADPTARDRFLAEARHAAGLNHSGIAQVHDFGDAAAPGEPDQPYLVMELVPGRPLADWLHDGHSLLPANAAHLVALAADAVAFAHSKGVVHRDLKPGNLLVRPDATVKVTDFGIAKALGSAPVTGTGLVLGTAAYLSPEQAAGNPVTPASDVYSLGVVLYEALSGRRPFVRETPVAVALAHVRDTPDPLPPEVPAGLASTVERAMAKDPAHRPDATELADELRRPLDAPPAVAPAVAPVLAPTATLPATPVTAAPATPWWHRPLPLALAVLAALLLVGAGIGAASTLGGSDETPSASSQSTQPPVDSTPPEPTDPEATTTTSEPSTIAVVAEDYLLQDAKTVEEQLEALGLTPEEESLEDEAVLADPGLLELAEQVDPEVDEAVLRVTPTGDVAPGSTVVLEVWKVADLTDNGQEGEEGEDDRVAALSRRAVGDGRTS